MIATDALRLAILAGLVSTPAFSDQPPGDGVPAIPAVWQAQKSPVSVELRGLSVVSDRVAWASGARGTNSRRCAINGPRSWG